MNKLISFAQIHNIEFREFGDHHHVTFGWVNFDCPNCSPHTGRFRLGWNLKGGYFSCWSCGKLAVYSTWALLAGLSVGQIRQEFKDVDLRETVYQPQKPIGKLTIPPAVEPLRKPHRAYLERRGFDPDEIVKTWKVQSIGHLSPNPTLAWRLFIPVEEGGETISWTTRTISDNAPLRYLSAQDHESKFSIKDVLYGIDQCNGHTVLVVEGPLDVWKVGPGAAGIVGLSYSRSQLLQIARFPRRYICLDNEPGAQKTADKLCRELMMFPGETHNIQLDAKDPGEASEAELTVLKGLVQ